MSNVGEWWLCIVGGDFEKVFVPKTFSKSPPTMQSLDGES